MESNLKETIVDHLMLSRNLLDRCISEEHFLHSVETAAKEVTSALLSGNKILLAGNGGSAADAQHIAGELVSRFLFDRAALPGIALTTDTSVLTAIGNDYGYEQTFSRQVSALGRKGDVFIGISTSGNSPNILLALKKARDMELLTIGLTGAAGGCMVDKCDVLVRVPSKETPYIQQIHITVAHVVCAIAEEQIFGRSK